MEFNTALLHSENDDKMGAPLEPIYQTTAFQYPTAEELERVFQGRDYGYIYTRISNPTLAAFEKRVAALEKGIGAVACASGMAAVVLSLLSIVQHGQEILSGSGIYGGTFALFKELRRYGISSRWVGDNRPESFAANMNERTGLIYVESIGNPKLDVPDIAGLAALAHSRGVPLIVDNTTASPYLCRPLELGADIVLHSTSKYINGSGNSIGGIIVDSGRFPWDVVRYPVLRDYRKFGPYTYLARVRKGLLTDFGASMAPFNAYLNSLGLETLGLRMERICENALDLAAFLQEHPQVAAVNYPGLTSNASHELANQQFAGKFGGLLTVRLGSKNRAFRLIERLKYASNLANIGDVRTLVIHPASTLCLNHSAEEKEEMGVYEDLVRISVGIEDIRDLKHDFAQALDSTS